MNTQKHCRALLVVMLLFGPMLYAQFQNGLWTSKEAYYWYMALEKGFNFNQTPMEVLTNGQSYASKGGGTISDADGNLLFYTDGLKIWNRNHAVMLNGNNIASGAQATQSGLIVPAPGNPNLYYVFSVAKSNSNGGIFYSEVDMTLDGGLGGVNANKKVVLHGPGVAEKLTAVHHTDENQVWLVGHRANSNNMATSGDFVAYLITETGIVTTPVVSTVGLAFHQFKDGQMKISPDGTKIALVHSQGSVGPNILEVFNFDATTGVISAPFLSVNDRFSSFSSVWGLEFSPNSKLLYVTEIESRSRLYQYNLEAGDAQAIRDSEVILGEVEFLETFYGLQAAPDGKIYMAHNNRDYHSVINFPNNIGTAAGFEYMSPTTVTITSNSAFPGFIQSYFESGILFENLCSGDATAFSTIRIPGITAVSWDFGDTASADNTSTDLEPTHIFSAPGTYTVTAVITSNGAQQTTTNQVTILPLPAAVAPATQDLALCNDGNGNAVFDLTQYTATILDGQDANVFTLNYYASQADLDGGIVIAVPDAFSTSGQQIFAQVTNTVTGCTTVIDFELVVTPLPQVTAPANLDECQDGSGTAVFDLSGQNAVILGSLNPADYTITYYTTANETDPVTTPSDFTSAGQTIYAVIQNVATGCKVRVQFDLILNNPPVINAPVALQNCSNINGEAAFDLTAQNAPILATLNPADYTITYFGSEDDAVNGNNAIAAPQNFLSEDTTIYALVTNINTGCSSYTSFDLIVTPANLIPSGLTLLGCPPFDLTDATAELGEGLTYTFYNSEEDAIAGQNSIADFNRFVIQNNQSVFVLAVNAEGCATVSELALQLDNCTVPRGISPNNDTMNDDFNLSSFNVTKLSIFNRYGREVYNYSGNYTNQWHGQENGGNELPTGTYYYSFQNNNGESKTGWVYINRQVN